MDKDKPFTLKDTSSNKPKPNAVPINSPLNAPLIGDKKTPAPNEITNMLEQMKKMHDDLERKLDDTYQKTGLNPHFIKDFLNNPNNFQSDEWEKIQEKRDLLISQFGGKISKEITESKLTGPLQLPSSKAVDPSQKTEKERKTKTIGARRNWIPMR